MTRKGKLILSWLGMYVLCTIFGFIDTDNSLLKAIFALFSMGFFLPGGILLYEAVTDKDRKTVRIIRGISIASLTLTVVFIILNALTLPSTEAVGDRMNVLLIILSTPMFASQVWVLSLFLWACLLMGSFFKKTKKSEKEVDIKPMIYKFEVRDDSVYMLVATGSVENLKPELVMQALCGYLGVDAESVSFVHHRLDVYANVGTEEDKKFVCLDQV